MKKFTISKLTTLLLLVLSCSCDRLHDDQSNCETRLRFRYNYNMNYADLFASQVTRVQVFVFDSRGGYVATLSGQGAPLTGQGYALEMPYEFRGCTAVVWAGETDEYVVSELRTGDPISKLTLALAPQGGTSDARIKPLWHSGPVTLTYPNNGGREQTIDLVRTTNDVQLALYSPKTGANVDPSMYDIRITGTNGSYGHTHAPLTPGQTLAYIPAHYDATTAYLYTMRFVKGSDLQLEVFEKGTQTPVRIDGEEQIDLVDYLLRTRPEQMGEQEYLDRRYEWPLTFNLPADYAIPYLNISELEAIIAITHTTDSYQATSHTFYFWSNRPREELSVPQTGDAALFDVQLTIIREQNSGGEPDLAGKLTLTPKDPAAMYDPSVSYRDYTVILRTNNLARTLTLHIKSL